MIVFEPLASPGAASGALTIEGFARAASRGAFGFLTLQGSGNFATTGRASGELALDGGAQRATTGARGFGFMALAGSAAAAVSGTALGFLGFDRGAFILEHVPVARGDLDFELTSSAGYLRTQTNSPLGYLETSGSALAASLGGVARGELVLVGDTPAPLDPDAVVAFASARSSVAAVIGVDEDWVEDTAALGQAFRIDVSTLLIQRLRPSSGATSSAESSAALSDGVLLEDAIALTYRLLVAEGFVAGSTRTELYEAVARAQDGLLLTGVAATEAEAFSLITLGVLLGLREDAILRASFNETVVLGESLASDIEQVAQLLEGLRLGDAAAQYAVLVALVADGVKLADSAPTSAEGANLLAAALRFGLRLSLDSGEFTAWVLNTESKHLAAYSQFPINSFASIGGRVYGAADDGIYLLEGTDDEGTPVAAKLRFALTDLGTGAQKRMSAAYLGYTSTNDLLLQVIHTDDTGGKSAYTYRLDAAPATSPTNGRITLGRGVKSAYYGFQLTNVDGGMFDIDKMVVYPLALDRRINRS